MNKLTKEEIEALLANEAAGENNKEILSDRDAFVYQELFEALNLEPTTSLPYGFSSKVVRTIQNQKEKQSIFIQYALFALIAFAGIALGVNIINEELFKNLVSILVKFKWIIIFSVVAFYGIQYLDSRFVRNKIVV